MANDADRGRSRPSRVPPIVAGAVGLPLLWVGGLVFNRGSLERRLTDNVQSRLDERFAGVVVHFDGRDAEVSGQLPAGASAHDVYEFVRHQPGVRHVRSRLQSPSTDGELSAAVVELSIDRNGQMTLSGVVPSQLAKSQLKDAAARVGGDQTIEDRVAISAAVGPIPAQELDGLTNLVSSLPSDPTGELTVRWRNHQVTISGTATAVASRRIRNAAVALAGASNVKDTLTVTEPPTTTVAPTTAATTTVAPTTVAPTSVAPSSRPPSTAAPSTSAPPVPPQPSGAAGGPTTQGLASDIAALGDIRFSRDAANLTPASSVALDKLAELLRGAPDTTVVEIEGHTDSTGRAAYNLLLSQQRAEAVRLALIQRGVNPARLRGKARGEISPIASNETAAGRALNRRVHLRVVS